jgi:RND family efflux transporter MFP subunit
MKTLAERITTVVLCLWLGFTIGINRTALPAAALASRIDVPVTAPELTSGPCKDYVGVLVGKNTAQIAPRAPGRITAFKVRVGDHVKRGETLAELDSSAAAADLSAARAATKEAEAQAVRAAHRLQLAEEERKAAESLGSYASRQDLSSHQQEEKVAVANLAAAQAVLEGRRQTARRAERELLEYSLRAPFDGRVSRRYLDIGALLTAATPILEITDDSERILRFAVPSADRQQVVAGGQVRVNFDSWQGTLTGSIRRVAPEVDPVSDTILVEAELHDSGHALAVGSIARVSIGCPRGSGAPWRSPFNVEDSAR